MARPGIETRGERVDRQKLEETIIKELGLGRRLFSQLPEVDGVRRLVNLIASFPMFGGTVTSKELRKDLALQQSFGGRSKDLIPLNEDDLNRVKDTTPKRRSLVQKELEIAYRWLKPRLEAAKGMRKFVSNLPEAIDDSGFVEKFIVDQSSREDPALELGVAAVKKLLKDTDIDPADIGYLYVACTSARMQDPPLSNRILWRLVRDRIVPKEVAECNGSGDIGWIPDDLGRGCVGWVRVAQRIEREMLLNHFLGVKNKAAIAVAIGVNSMHMVGNNPHEIITYGDGAGAGLFELNDDNLSAFLSSAIRTKLSDADRVLHPYPGTVPEPDSIQEMIGRYFASNFISSTKVAKTLSEEVPVLLSSLLEKNGLTLDALDHVVISQTSSSVLDIITVRLGADFIKREKLNLKVEEIRPELRRLIEDHFPKSKEINKSERKRKFALCNYFLKVIESKRDEEVIFDALKEDEQKLFIFLMELYYKIPRYYSKHGYTGVASIPMAIAQGVEEKKIDLSHPMAWIGTGLGINIEGALSVDRVNGKRKGALDLESKLGVRKKTVACV